MVVDALPKSLPSPAFIGHRRVMMGQTPSALKFLHSLCVYFVLEYCSSHDFSCLLIFLDCPVCSVNDRIVHGEEGHIIH